MISSGKKRGLAVSAISALAVSGLAFSPAQAGNIQDNDGAAVELYTPIDGVSGQTAGGKTTTTLAASAGNANVNSFVFYYSLDGVVGDADDVEIADVANLNGWGSTQWTLPANPTLADIELVYVEAQSNTDVVLSTDQSATLFDPGNASDHNQVNIDGNYLEPLGVWNGNATLTGVSSDNDPIDIDFDIAGPVSDEGDSNPIIAGPTTAAGTPFAANVSVGANDTGDAYDEVVGRMADTDEGSDAQVYTLYDQVVAGVDVSYDPAFPPNVNGVPANENTQWILTVTDQNGKPITGVEIFESDAAGNDLLGFQGMGRLVDNSATFNDGTTNELGQLTVRLNEDGVYGIDGAFDQNPAVGVGSTYVVIDKNDDGNFDNGVDEIVELTINALPQAPASLEIMSSLGEAMDADEDTNISVLVKDANGDPIQDATVALKVDRDVADNTPPDATQVFASVDTNGSGVANFGAIQPGINNNEVAALFTATSGAASDTLAIETDEAVVVWDSGANAQALANTDTTEGGKVQLPSGTPLPNRHVDITLTPTDNTLFSPQAEQPAGTIRGGDTIADATTDANGAFSVKIDDPAAPVGEELDNNIRATFDDSGDFPFADLDLDWLRSLTPARIEILNGLPGAPAPLVPSTADGLEPLLATQLIPGAAAAGQVVVYNSDDTRLDNVSVNLTIDEGFFVDNFDAFENVAIGAPVDLKSQGQTFTVVTGDALSNAIGLDTAGVFIANIERHEGFDDDGLVQDHVHATAGATSDEHDVDWTTIGNPLNPRATDPLVVELSDDQESSVLPKARAGNTAIDGIPGDGSGQVVDYDVNTWDQFGNRTQQNTNETDNTPLAGFVSTGTSDFDLNQPSISAFASTATNQSIEVELEGPVTTTYFDDVNDSSFDPLNPLNDIQQLPVVVEDNTETVNWYNLDFGASTFTLGQQGPETVPVGTAVTEVVKATDQEGQAIENMFVDFLRGGPGSEDDDSCNEDLLNNCQVTDANGESFYDFVGGSAGTANVSAVLYSAEGARITTVGPDTVVFSGQNEPQKINALLRGKSSQGKDILKVKAPSVAAGAKVVLQKKVGNKWVKIGKTKKLDGSGDRQFGVKDRNGNKVTKYRAKVRATDNNRADTTPVLRQR